MALKINLFSILLSCFFISCKKPNVDINNDKQNLFYILNKFDKKEFPEINNLKDTSLVINNLSSRKINNILNNYNSYYPKENQDFKELYNIFLKEPKLKYCVQKGSLILYFGKPIYNRKKDKILLYNEVSNKKTYNEAFFLLLKKTKDSLIVLDKEQVYTTD